MFGDRVLDNNKLNREELANIIYNDMNAKNNLDKLTFKFVCEEIEQKVDYIKKNSNCEYILIDAPLLIESNLNKKCNIVISVIASKEIKISRICQRDKISKEIANKRLNIQKNDEYYISNSSFTIKNDNDNLDNQINELCMKIKYIN